MAMRAISRLMHTLGWAWKPLLAVFVVFVLLCFRFRSWAIEAIPDIPEPVDLVAAAHVDVPAEKNAFELYRVASERLHPLPAELREEYDAAVRNDWASLPDKFRDWLDENRDLLEIYRRGSKRSDAVYIQPGDLTVTTFLGVANDVQAFARLAQLEALRIEAEGDYQGAWDWYCTILRSSRHLGRNGGLIERTIGGAVHARVARQIARWCAHPGVDVVTLRRALDDARENYNNTVSASATIGAEYLMRRKIFDDPLLVNDWLPGETIVPVHVTWQAMRPLGEPVTSQRLMKIVFTNWLSQCDLPRNERTPTRLKHGMVFLPDPTVGFVFWELAVDRLENWQSRALLSNLTMSAIEEFLNFVDCEAAQQRLLETALALQIFRSREGHYPETLDELVGRELDTRPIDLFGDDGLVGYRLGKDEDEEIMLWSVGPKQENAEARDDETGEPPEGAVILRIRPRQAE